MTCKETHASCLRYDDELGCLVYDNNLGESKPVKLPAPTLSGLLNADCELVIFANNIPLEPIDLTPLLAKVQGSVADLDFRPGPCSLVWTPPDGSESQTFDLSAILDKAQDGATYNPTTCVLSYTNVIGETKTFSLASVLDKALDDLAFDPTDCVLTYTNVLGNQSDMQLTSLFNKMTFDATTCILSVPVPAGVKNFDLSQILAKIAVAYDPVTHSLVVNNNGNITSQVINCSSLELITSGETCVLRFTNAKGQVNDMPLPGSSFTRNTEDCTITVGNGKGGGFTFREGLDPVADITFSLTANKDLKLQVKDECMEIILPDFVTAVSISDDNCELKIFKWCTDPVTIDIFAALGLDKNDDGGFDLQIKDQICTFSPATLVVNPDNPNEFIFNNQFGQTTIITVPTVSLDMDGATLTGSVLQLTFGGDGNPGQLDVDICAIVGANCNASLTANADGSYTHVSNTGVTTQVPAPPSSTVIDNGDGTGTMTQTDGTTCDFLKEAPDQIDVTVQGDGYNGSVQVGTDPAIPFLQRIDDCEGNEIDVSAERLITLSNLLGMPVSEPLACAAVIPADCYPELPACAINGFRTTKDGITFELQSGAWVPVGLNAWTDCGPVNDETMANGSIDDAAIAALPGSITDPAAVIDCISETYTNNKCFPVTVKFTSRVQVSGITGVIGNRWNVQWRPDLAVNDGLKLGTGGPNFQLNSYEYEIHPLLNEGDPLNYFRSTYLASDYWAEINPGDSATVRWCLQAQQLQYEPSALNQISWVGALGRWQAWATC